MSSITFPLLKHPHSTSPCFLTSLIVAARQRKPQCRSFLHQALPKPYPTLEQYESQLPPTFAVRFINSKNAGSNVESKKTETIVARNQPLPTAGKKPRFIEPDAASPSSPPSVQAKPKLKPTKPSSPSKTKFSEAEISKLMQKTACFDELCQSRKWKVGFKFSGRDRIGGQLIVPNYKTFTIDNRFPTEAIAKLVLIDKLVSHVRGKSSTRVTPTDKLYASWSIENSLTIPNPAKGKSTVIASGLPRTDATVKAMKNCIQEDDMNPGTGKDSQQSTCSGSTKKCSTLKSTTNSAKVKSTDLADIKAAVDAMVDCMEEDDMNTATANDCQPPTCSSSTERSAPIQSTTGESRRNTVNPQAVLGEAKPADVTSETMIEMLKRVANPIKAVVGEIKPADVTSKKKIEMLTKEPIPIKAVNAQKKLANATSEKKIEMLKKEPIPIKPAQDNVSSNEKSQSRPSSPSMDRFTSVMRERNDLISRRTGRAFAKNLSMHIKLLRKCAGQGLKIVQAPAPATNFAPPVFVYAFTSIEIENAIAIILEELLGHSRIGKDGPNNAVVGFDIGYSSGVPKILQLATEDISLVIDLSLLKNIGHRSDIPSLIDLLSSRVILKVGVGIELKVLQLKNCHRVGVSNFVDLRHLQPELDLKSIPSTYGASVTAEAKRKADNSQKTIDLPWTSSYGAYDAYHTYKAFKKLEDDSPKDPDSSPILDDHVHKSACTRPKVSDPLQRRKRR